MAWRLAAGCLAMIHESRGSPVASVDPDGEICESVQLSSRVVVRWREDQADSSTLAVARSE
jgi:hypothetical protein